MSRLIDTVCVSKLMPKSLVCLIRRYWLLFSGKEARNQETKVSSRSKLNALDCRVKPEKGETSSADIFSVEICGMIHAPRDQHNASVKITIIDVTDEPEPVHSSMGQWQRDDSHLFCYNANIGKLPNSTTVLSDWMSVARLRTDWLILPLEGKRKLQFNIAILSCQNSEELACGVCEFDYDNEAFGYIELQEKAEYIKAKAVTLAFAVGSASKKINKYGVRTIKDWAQNNICSEAKSKKNLNKALRQAIRFFNKGNTVDVFETCAEIVKIATLVERYNILELCLKVLRTNGSVSAKQLGMLKDLATWLEVDRDRFRAMVERILPAEVHESEDVEIVLGITADMSRETALHRINNEYRKWNGRVTNPDAAIHARANYMLQFIAQARSEYTQ